ncbi:delta(12) fatty acid desaturase-like protein [Tanacetum coccineum]
MGAGGQMNVSKLEKDVLKRVPVSKPPFGVGDLKKTIPPHCFKRPLIRSFGSLFHDLILIYSLYYIASSYIRLLPQTHTYVAWPLYWVAQSGILVRLWVLGHDCGHHAFSEYQWIDDAVGFFVHTVTMTPYFSFKYSHARHHAHTSSIEFEEVHVPKRKSDTLFSEVLNNGPGNVLRLFLMVTLGLPLYLFINMFGRDYGKFANHFWPHSAIFNDRQRAQIVLSDVGIIAVMYALYHHAMTQGVHSTLFLFGIPLFGMSCFFVIITYLNHTHPSLARYDLTEWDWLRGALSTVDRDLC